MNLMWILIVFKDILPTNIDGIQLFIEISSLLLRPPCRTSMYGTVVVEVAQRHIGVVFRHAEKSPISIRNSDNDKLPISETISETQTLRDFLAHGT